LLNYLAKYSANLLFPLPGIPLMIITLDLGYPD